MRAADGAAIAEVAETWLCACGASKDKPYCDGSHAGTDFCNTEQLPSAGAGADAFGASPSATADGGVRLALTIRTRKDGPLKVTGPVEVISPEGVVLLRGEETALCRCGHSASKPFCDGTHRTIGFAA